MTDIRDLTQRALDNALVDDAVRSFWQRKTDTEGANPSEYIVYTLDSDTNESYADNSPLIKSANVTVRYYYRTDLLDSYSGRGKVKAREIEIEAAMLAAGFTVPFGPSDTGDIDNIGFGVTVFECYFDRLVGA